MTKSEMLRMLELLSALEALALSPGNNIPDHLFDEIAKVMEKLREEILK